MKAFIISVVFAFTAIANLSAQKVKMDGDTALVDGEAQFIITSENMGNLFRVKNMGDTLLMTFMYVSYSHPSKVTSANPEGREVYVEVTFLNDGRKCEFKPVGMGKKMFAKQIVKNKLIENGAVSVENENTFVTIYGTLYSQQRNALLGGGTININIDTK